MKKNKKIFLFSSILISSLFLHKNALAQKTITWQQAIDSAIKNNLNQNILNKKAQNKEQLISSYKNIAPTNFSAEYGQVNSMYLDSRFSLSQNLTLPKVNNVQKKYLTQEYYLTVAEAKTNEAFLKKQILLLYSYALYLQQKKHLLNTTDSLYKKWQTALNLKLLNGEGTETEYAFAKNEISRIALEILNNNSEILSVETDLKNIIQINNADYNFNYNNELIELGNKEINISNHQLIKLSQQEENVAQQNIELEKMKLLPSFGLGYSNMSINGIGADDINYGFSQRFSSVQLNTAIPIFNKSIKAKIKNAQVEKTIIQMQTEATIKQLQTDANIHQKKYSALIEIINQFKTNENTTLNTIYSSANKELQQGNINYLQWHQIMQQTYQQKLQYIEMVYQTNKTIAQLFFLSQNN